MRIKSLLFIVLSYIGSLFINAQTNVDFITAVQNYQDSVKIIYIDSLGKDVIDENTFNLKTYLQLFDEIEFDDKLKYGYTYLDNFLDGYPYIYVVEPSFNLEEYIKNETLKKIKTDTIYKFQFSYKVPFDSAEILYTETSGIDYIAYNQEEYNSTFHHILFYFLNDFIPRAYNHVVPKNTENGYLQYLFFHELGENFALKWHAAYKERSVICTREQINAIIEYYSNSELYDVSEKNLNKLLKIVPTPIVEMDIDYCIVTWYEETHFTVNKKTYKITRHSPYVIEQISDEVLVYFNPMFLF